MTETLRERLERLLAGKKATQDLGPERIYGDIWYELLDCGEGETPFAEWLFIPKKKHINRYGSLHGGLISALFDSYMGNMASAFSGRNVSSATLTVNYLAPCTGKRYVIRVEGNHIGRQLVGCYATMTDLDSRVVVANSTGHFAVLTHMPDPIDQDGD